MRVTKNITTADGSMTSYEIEWLKYSHPTWIKFECDHGRRWTTVKEGICHEDHTEGSPCNFSGCQPGHSVHIRGETTDRNEAHDWFRNPALSNPLSN